MKWLRVDQGLCRHRKTIRAAKLLGVDRPLVVGFLIGLWSWAQDNVDITGYLSLENDEIAFIVGWSGDADKLVDALISCGGDGVGFIEIRGGKRYLHDWASFQGWYKGDISADIKQAARRLGGRNRAASAARDCGKFLPNPSQLNSQLDESAGISLPVSYEPAENGKLGTNSPAEPAYDTIRNDTIRNDIKEKKQRKKSVPKIITPEVIAKNKTDYPALDVDLEFRKSKRWCEEQGRPHTPRMFENWLDNAVKFQAQKTPSKAAPAANSMLYELTHPPDDIRSPRDLIFERPGGLPIIITDATDRLSSKVYELLTDKEIIAFNDRPGPTEEEREERRVKRLIAQGAEDLI